MSRIPKTAQKLMGSMFEPTKAPPPIDAKPKVSGDRCPRCNGSSRKTVRPGDHDGKTHFCSNGCIENGDMLYFTPSEPVPF
jgi:hypothetical protein